VCLCLAYFYPALKRILLADTPNGSLPFHFILLAGLVPIGASACAVFFIKPRRHGVFDAPSRAGVKSFSG
jgi:hypothetical protein